MVIKIFLNSPSNQNCQKRKSFSLVSFIFFVANVRYKFIPHCSLKGSNLSWRTCTSRHTKPPRTKGKLNWYLTLSLPEKVLLMIRSISCVVESVFACERKRHWLLQPVTLLKIFTFDVLHYFAAKYKKFILVLSGQGDVIFVNIKIYEQ